MMFDDAVASDQRSCANLAVRADIGGRQDASLAMNVRAIAGPDTRFQFSANRTDSVAFEQAVDRETTEIAGGAQRVS